MLKIPKRRKIGHFEILEKSLPRELECIRARGYGSTYERVLTRART
jgi:hypothetical protein